MYNAGTIFNRYCDILSDNLSYHDISCVNIFIVLIHEYTMAMIYDY